MSSQEKIHKLDLSDIEVPVELRLDILLSDLREQFEMIVEAKTTEERNQRISMMGEYLRGMRDGNRFTNNNPLSKIKSNK